MAHGLLHREVKRRRHPVRETTTLSKGKQSVDLTAALVPTIALAGDLEAIITTEVVTKISPARRGLSAPCLARNKWKPQHDASDLRMLLLFVRRRILNNFMYLLGQIVI